jgi:hypothetical protein
MLINEAKNLVVELPEPSQKQFEELIKAIEQSTKMSAMNPSSKLYHFKSTYEKKVIAKHPDYQDGLKVAQKLTAPHRIREFLKEAFDVRGVYRMLVRLHHNESRDAARAELTLKLTDQYLMQLNNVNADEVVNIQNLISKELDKIWNDTTAQLPKQEELEALGDNVSTPVLTRRAPLYTRALKPNVSLIQEHVDEQSEPPTTTTNLLQRLRSKVTDQFSTKKTDSIESKFDNDIDAYFESKATIQK